jgi:hypothetical protein
MPMDKRHTNDLVDAHMMKKWLWFIYMKVLYVLCEWVSEWVGSGRLLLGVIWPSQLCRQIVTVRAQVKPLGDPHSHTRTQAAITSWISMNLITARADTPCIVACIFQNLIWVETQQIFMKSQILLLAVTQKQLPVMLSVNILGPCCKDGGNKRSVGFAAYLLYRGITCKSDLRPAVHLSTQTTRRTILYVCMCVSAVCSTTILLAFVATEWKHMQNDVYCVHLHCTYNINTIVLHSHEIQKVRPVCVCVCLQ